MSKLEFEGQITSEEFEAICIAIQKASNLKELTLKEIEIQEGDATRPLNPEEVEQLDKSLLTSQKLTRLDLSHFEAKALDGLVPTISTLPNLRILCFDHVAGGEMRKDDLLEFIEKNTRLEVLTIIDHVGKPLFGDDLDPKKGEASAKEREALAKERRVDSVLERNKTLSIYESCFPKGKERQAIHVLRCIIEQQSKATDKSSSREILREAIAKTGFNLNCQTFFDSIYRLEVSHHTPLFYHLPPQFNQLEEKRSLKRARTGYGEADLIPGPILKQPRLAGPVSILVKL